MRLPQLLATLEREDERLARVRLARAQVDEAGNRYGAAQKHLARLEQRASNAQAVQLARDDVHAARVDLKQARRALLRSIA